ncbi:MAG: hypothetical protein KC470_01470 [Dehalococcoidia bacterium]|nr:hypothetical protein [Dehalococcoidia bacterium]
MVKDRLPGGELVAGGPALYCARAAIALEASVDLVTHLPARFPPEAIEGVNLVGPVVETFPIFENTYDGHTRNQRMTGESLPLDARLAGYTGAGDALLLAPAFRELSGWPPGVVRVRAVSLQGVLRDRDGESHVRPRDDALPAAMAFAEPGTMAVFSDEDCSDPMGLALALAAAGMIVALTHGDRGTSLFSGECRKDYDAIPTGGVVDPTGAGDCFTTALVLRYAETGDLEEAMTWGLAAGSIAVEREGLRAAATRDELRHRIAGRAA